MRIGREEVGGGDAAAAGFQGRAWGEGGEGESRRDRWEGEFQKIEERGEGVWEGGWGEV
jgi:hypothetical protein